MIRTQISLDEEDYRRAKREARRLGVSLAEYFRRALERMLPVRSKKPWMKYAGFVASGNPKSSQEIDDVVYGQKT